MKKVLIRAVIIIAITLCSINKNQAQEHRYNLGLHYTTEVQSDFGKKVNWVNLLLLKAMYKPWQNGELSLQTITIGKTRKERIIDDFQTFSNIEEDNMALNIFLAGYTHHFKDISLFGGIRNVNEDYFTGDYTSLFTNSSCGIYPTISVNFPIANYPLSAMCIHGEFELSKTFKIKNSLYNGTPRKLFSDEGSLFAINPKRDGVLNITELSYLRSKSDKHESYNIGSVLYIDNYIDSIPEQKEEEEKKTKVNYALWGSIEKSIYSLKNKSIGILLQGSLAPASRNECNYYYGAGLILNSIIPTRTENMLGIFYNRAIFRENTENTIEITWKYDINDCLTFQPTLHYIKTGSTTKFAGVIRVCYNIIK